MKLVARLKSIEEINILNQLGVDAFLLDCEFTTKRISNYSLSMIHDVKKETDRLVFVLINIMVHEYHLEALNEFLNKLSKIDIDGIVINDLTVYVLALKHGIEDKIIYQPGTMNTELLSMEFLQDKGLKQITISREITLDEIKSILINNSKLKLSLKVHGFLDMFYSKRKLVTNYLIHKGIEGKNLVNNYDLRLNEEIRPNDFYPILEDEYGTHIFRSKKLISLDELKDINDELDTIFIERIFMDDKEYYDSIRLYKNMIHKADFLEKYDNYDSGFYYKKTEKIKGENDEA
jgi:putative protease